jgi:lambda family phage portal protein
MATKTAKRTTKKQASKKQAAPRRQAKSVAKQPKSYPRPVRARYDAAQNDAENRKHWANADALSAASANSRAVRLTLRNRSRYETANNGYLRGMVNTLANHVIGTGPRLQVDTGDEKLDESIEREFAKHCKAIRLGAKLRTMQIAKRQDGESFALKVTNPALETAVKLDLRLIEADQVATPTSQPEVTPTSIDGIEFDDAGNPSVYYLLRSHPGDIRNAVGSEADKVRASEVLHWFRCDRPGQLRGIPETTPSLSLFAQLRRYTLATVAAAETVANFAMVAQSNLAPDTDDAAPDPFEELELQRNMLTVLPQGWQLGQVDPKQPITGYKEFKNEIINEAARPFDMPFNIAACNSSGYNYSSGRLDHQTYWVSVGIEQSDCESVVVNPFFRAWLVEAALAGIVPADVLTNEEMIVEWNWDGQTSIDAQKDAGADALDLENGTESLSCLIAKRGHDWRKVMRQRAKELKYASELETEYGVKLKPAPPPAAGPPGAKPPGGEAEEVEEEEVEEEAADAAA